MSADVDKAIELLSKLLGSDETESPDDYNEIQEETEDDIELKEDNENQDLQNIFSAFSGGEDKRVTLLSSIKPYMSGKRQGKVDTAIQIVRLLSLSSGLGITNLFKQ